MNRTPQTLLEAVTYFAGPDRALRHFAAVRWPNGVACPRHGCGSASVQFIATRKLWRCKECKRQFTAKVGTVFEDSPIPFTKWLPAVWFLANTKNGIARTRSRARRHAAYHVVHAAPYSRRDERASHRNARGTYISVRGFHLDAYLDEQVFRFNARDGVDAGRFLSTLQGADGRRPTYAALTSSHPLEAKTRSYCPRNRPSSQVGRDADLGE